MYIIFCFSFFFFFFNDTATTEIYTLSLHDALPVFTGGTIGFHQLLHEPWHSAFRSEEHTSELQSHVNLVCRLLLEKKKKNNSQHIPLKKKKKNTTYVLQSPK